MTMTNEPILARKNFPLTTGNVQYGQRRMEHNNSDIIRDTDYNVLHHKIHKAQANWVNEGKLCQRYSKANIFMELSILTFLDCVTLKQIRGVVRARRGRASTGCNFQQCLNFPKLRYSEVPTTFVTQMFQRRNIK